MRIHIDMDTTETLNLKCTNNKARGSNDLAHDHVFTILSHPCSFSLSMSLKVESTDGERG